MADLDAGHKVLEVGSGTGYTTLGIAEEVDRENIITLDQNPYQHSKAVKKEKIMDIKFYMGDSENLPFTDAIFDRYISAGSIEYWPDPLKAIREAKRVTKKDGKALIIGPVKPKHQPFRYICETVMLFPTIEEYLEWFREAGFTEINHELCRPPWFVSDYGIVISGIA